MKYLLYEGENNSILFSREDKIAASPGVLEPFTNKAPTFTVEADNDSEAIQRLNEFMASRTKSS